MKHVGMYELALLAVSLAAKEVGHGEVGQNNVGPDIARYMAPAKPPGEWCAAFVGWLFEEAARSLVRPLPFKRSLGAKGLGNAIAAVGRRYTDPHKAQPGDVVVWHSWLGPLSWHGHIGLITAQAEGVIHTIEGNTGAYPSRVRALVHDVTKERLAFMASLRAG